MYNYLDEQGVAKLSELINSDIEAVDSRVEDVENALTTVEVSSSGYTTIPNLKGGVPFNYITVKGKNIIYSFTQKVPVSSGLTPTYDDANITVTLNGTPTGSAFIDLFNGLLLPNWQDKKRSRLKPGVYTISSSTFDNNMFWAVEKRNKSDNQFAGYCAIGVSAPGANYLTFTITEEDFDSFYFIFQLCVNPGESYSDFIVYPQVEEGSVATEHATSILNSGVMFMLNNSFVYSWATSDPVIITDQYMQIEGTNWIDVINTPSMPIVTVNANNYKTPLSAVYTKINGVDNRVSTVESSVSGMSSEISDLTSRVSYNEIAIQTNIENIAAVDTRVDNAESEIAANTSDINSLGGRVTTSEGDITSLDNRVTALEQGGGGSSEKLKYNYTPLIKYAESMQILFGSTDAPFIATSLATTKNFIFVSYTNSYSSRYTYYTPKYNALTSSTSFSGGTSVEALVPNFVKSVDDYTISETSTGSTAFYREVNGVIVKKSKSSSDILYNLNYYFYTNAGDSFCSKDLDSIVWRKFTDLIPSLPSDVVAIKKGFAYSDSTDTNIFLYSASENKVYEILNFSSSNMMMYTYSLTDSTLTWSYANQRIIGIDGKLYASNNSVYTVYEFNRGLNTCTPVLTDSLNNSSLDSRYGFVQNKYSGTVLRIDKGKKKLFRSTTIPIFTDGSSYTGNGSGSVPAAPRVDFDNMSYVRYSNNASSQWGVYYPTGTSANTLKHHYYFYYMEDQDYE